MLIKRIAFQSKNLLFRPKAIGLYKQIVKESRLDAETREKIRFKRLQDLVKDAFDNTPFYHELYLKAGLDDGIITSFHDFEQLPTLKKDHLRNCFDEIVNRKSDPRKRKISTTGGSTGIPVKVYHDTRIPADPFEWFVLREFGGDISDNAAFLIRYNPHKSRFSLNRLMWYPTRRCFLDVSLLTEKGLRQYYEQCRRIRPAYLQGYVGAVQEFASFLEHNHLVIPSLRFVWTTAAPLSESNRKFMEDVFKVPVYNQYGCCEVLFLACECRKQNGLHYFDTFRHFEVCDENMKPVSDDTEGEFLLTDLTNHAFPLIRYQNGDRVCKLSRKCTCGNCFPLISSVKGRMTDIIRLPDGGSIPGDFMTTLFDDAPGTVGGFQIIQHKDYSLTLSYVPVNDESHVQAEKVCERLRNRLAGSSITITKEATASIAHDRGKTRFVVSEIK